MMASSFLRKNSTCAGVSFRSLASAVKNIRCPCTMQHPAFHRSQAVLREPEHTHGLAQPQAHQRAIPVDKIACIRRGSYMFCTPKIASCTYPFLALRDAREQPG